MTRATRPDPAAGNVLLRPENPPDAAGFRPRGVSPFRCRMSPAFRASALALLLRALRQTSRRRRDRARPWRVSSRCPLGTVAASAIALHIASTASSTPAKCPLSFPEGCNLYIAGAGAVSARLRSHSFSPIEMSLGRRTDDDPGGFIADYNSRFARTAMNGKDLHRPLSPQDDLDEIPAWREQRTVTRNLTLHYDRMMLILDPTPLARGLARQKVDVVNYTDGRFAVRFNGTELPFKVFDKIRTVEPGTIVENKRLTEVLAHVQAQQAAYAPNRRRFDPARQRPPNNLEAPGLPSKGRAPRGSPAAHATLKRVSAG